MAPPVTNRTGKYGTPSRGFPVFPVPKAGNCRKTFRSMSVGTAMSFAPGGVSGRPFEPRATQKAEPGGRAQFTLVNLLPKSF